MKRTFTIGLLHFLVGCNQSALTIADVRAKHGIETSVIVYKVDGEPATSSHFYQSEKLVFVRNSKSGEICYTAIDMTDNVNLNCDGQEN